MTRKRNYFIGKTVLVTGGSGSIGSEIVKQLAVAGTREVRVYSRDEFKQFLLQQELSGAKNIRYMIGDVRDYHRLDEAMRGCDFVFHTAAMKHITFCENNPGEAVKTNVIGSQNVVSCALKNKVPVVVGISTDKAANPTTMMGKTKLVMEGLFTSQISRNTSFCVVRLGNIMNSRGSVVPLWVDQIQRGLKITITDKRMMRYLMEVQDAARLIIKAGIICRGREIFVIKMEEKNIFNLAREIVKRYGNGKNIGIQLIGLRCGEKLREELLTREEKVRAIENSEYYIITPANIPGTTQRRKHG